MICYHSTFSHNIARIQRLGIRPNQFPNWKMENGNKFTTDGLVFFSIDKVSAIVWATKMQWEFRSVLDKAPDYRSIIICEFEQPTIVLQDPNTSPLHTGSEHWRCTTETVHPTNFYPLIPQLIAQAVAANNHRAS